jgi:hypothetical protein
MLMRNDFARLWKKAVLDQLKAFTGCLTENTKTNKEKYQ